MRAAASKRTRRTRARLTTSFKWQVGPLTWHDDIETMHTMFMRLVVGVAGTTVGVVVHPRTLLSVSCLYFWTLFFAIGPADQPHQQPINITPRHEMDRPPVYYSGASTTALSTSSSAAPSSLDAPQTSLPRLPELLHGRMSTKMLEVWAVLQKADEGVIRELFKKQKEVDDLKEDVTECIKNLAIRKAAPTAGCSMSLAGPGRVVHADLPNSIGR